MSGRRRISDRRACPRFEIVGDLSGVLELAWPLPVVDVSTGGALIESDRRWAIGSVHSVVIANGVEVGNAQICIKHVRPASEGAARFLIGVEFLSLSPALADEVARWVAADGETATGRSSTE